MANHYKLNPVKSVFNGQIEFFLMMMFFACYGKSTLAIIPVPDNNCNFPGWQKNSQIILPDLSGQHSASNNQSIAAAAVPFVCTSDFFFTIGGDAGEGKLSTVDQSDPSNMLDIYSYPFRMNGTGYNQFDNFIYTVGKTAPYKDHVMRLHGDGTFADLGDIGLPSDIVVGGFASDGLWYVKEGSNPEVYVIDVSSLTYTVMTPSGMFEGKDWAYSEVDGKFYGADNYDMLYTFDPVTGEVTSAPLSGMLPENGITFGAAFYAIDGYVYVYNNLSGYFYRLDVASNQALFVFQGPTDLTAVDGCSCPYSPPPIPVTYANDDTICVFEPFNNYVEILLNDSVNIAQLDFSSFSIVENPSNGTISYDPVTGIISYTAFTPIVDDQFVYSICCDGPIVTCDVATVYFVAAPEITFDPPEDYCVGEIPEDLSTISNEGITGVWTPSVINTSVPGISTYVFSPDTELFPCAQEYNMEVTVLPLQPVNFLDIDPLCVGDTGPDLPEQSQEGVTGTWAPATISTVLPGIFTYIFTPDESAFPCSEPFELDIQVLPQIEIEIIDTICSDDLQSFDLVISITGGSGTYDEINADGNIVTNSGNGIFIIESVPAGSDLNILVSDLVACEAFLGIKSIVCTCPVIPLPTGTENIHYCYGEPIPVFTIDDPGIDLEGIWLSSDLTVLGYGNEFTPPGSGTYFVYLQNEINNCTGDNIMVEAIENEQITMHTTSSVCTDTNQPFDLEVIINGGSPSYLVSSAGYTVTMTNEHSFVIHDVVDVSGIEVLVSDQAGCIREEILAPEILEAPIAGLDDATTISCELNYAVLSTIDNSGDFSYEWQNEHYQVISTQPTLTVTESGMYHVILTNTVTGCKTEDSTRVFPPLYPEFSFESHNISCFGDNNGSIQFTVLASGHPPYLYSIDGGINFSYDEIYAGLSPGTYNILVTTGGECAIDTSVTITQPDLVVATIAGDEIISCKTGKAILTAANILPGLSYQWFDENNDLIASTSGLELDLPGTYHLLVSDPVSGCFDADTITVAPSNMPVFNLLVDDVSCHGDQNGKITFFTNPLNQVPLQFSIDGGVSYTFDSVFTALNGGVYEIVISAGGDCLVETSVEILEPAPVIAEIAGDEIISCKTGVAILKSQSNTPGLNFQWFNSKNQLISTMAEITVVDPEAYLLIVTDPVTGCSSKDSVNVEPANLPAFHLETVNVSCNGDQNGKIDIIPDLPGTQTLSYSIDNGNTFTSNGKFENLNGGTYLVIVTTGGDCTADTLIIIDEPEAILANITADESISCTTGKALLSAGNIISGLMIEWKDEMHTFVSGSWQVEVQKAGKYYLTFSNAITGCFETDSVVIDPAVFPGFDLEVDDRMCFGENNGSILFIPDNGSTNYQFSINNGLTYSTNKFFGNLAPGVYQLAVKTDMGCRVDSLANIIQLDAILLDIEPYVEIELGENIELNLEINLPLDAIGSIAWTPAGSLSCSDCRNPVANPVENTIYQVVVSDTLGCSAEDQIEVKVRKELNIFIPNVFTPNGDNLNEIFFIKSDRDNWKIVDFRIFDRWGELVYYAQNILPSEVFKGWDGKKNGQDALPGVYAYLIKIEFAGTHEAIYSGDITLIK